MPSFESTIERPVIVSFELTPATRGRRDRLGVPMEPDEPATVEILEVRDAITKARYYLDGEDEEALREAILEDNSDAP